MHRVWVTDPLNPREVLDVMKNETLIDYVSKSMDSLRAGGGDWKFYFWTQDKTLIPRTTKWMEEKVYIVREFKELPSYDSTLQQVLEEYTTEDLRSASASDLMR